MKELTQKQKDNRLYHQRNAEKIREKKRAQYAEKVAAGTDKKPALARRGPNHKAGTPMKVVNPERAKRKKSASDVDNEVVKMRRLLEDKKLSLELGIDISEL